MTQYLLIEQGFGSGTGDTISIRGPHGAPNSRLTEVLLSYGCYKPAISKIIQCLTYSGRYDCEVQSIWFRHQYWQLKRDLQSINLDVHILRLTDNYYTKSSDGLKREIIE